MTVPKPSKKQKIPRPTRDEFELQELAEKLNLAHEEKKPLTLLIWRADDPISGTIEKMDPNTKTVHVKERFGKVIKVPFMDILKAEEVQI